jgi:hypothetical protein
MFLSELARKRSALMRSQEVSLGKARAWRVLFDGRKLRQKKAAFWERGQGVGHFRARGGSVMKGH